MTETNIYASVHAYMDKYNGFIVPDGITVRVYAIPGTVIWSNKPVVNYTSEYIEYRSGDFMYDLKYSNDISEVMYSELTVENKKHTMINTDFNIYLKIILKDIEKKSIIQLILNIFLLTSLTLNKISIYLTPI